MGRGIEEGIIKMAKTLYEEGMSLDKISKISGLDLEKLKKLLLI